MKKCLLISLFFITINYSFSQTFSWATSIGSTGNDIGFSIALDGLGNSYNTGSFNGVVDFDPSIGTYTLASEGNEDVFVSKTDVNGNFVWVKRIGGADADLPNFIKLDAVGNIYVTGGFNGIVDFDPSASIYTLAATPAWDGDAFILKLDANGNFIWAKTIGSVGYDVGTSIDIDTGGNIYLGGLFQSTVDFDPSSGNYTIASVGTSNAFILNLDALGNFIWAKSLEGNSFSYSKINSIKVDATGNIYTTGSFIGSIDFDPSPSSYILSSVAAAFFGMSEDIFVLKLDTSGNFIWAKKMGDSEIDSGISISIDNSGNIFATGNFQGTVDFDPGVGTYSLVSNGGYDVFVLKLDAFGNFVWAKSMGGNSLSYALATTIAQDAIGNIYIAGHFEGIVDFNPSSSTYTISSINSDAFILKLDANGNFLWAKSMGGNGYDIANSISLSTSGDIHATGLFATTADFDPDVAVYNQVAVGGLDIFIAKLSCINSSISGPLSVCGGASADYTVSGTQLPSNFNWQTSADSNINSGQNTTQINVSFGILPESITVISNNACGIPVLSALNVSVASGILVAPSNQTVTIGSNAQFITIPQSTVSTFQWQENSGFGFVNLFNTASYSGVNTATLTLSNITLNQNTNQYLCVVSEGSCSSNSNPAMLSVINITSIKTFEAENNLVVYPNPSNSCIRIKLSNNNSLGYIITDQTGKHILDGNISPSNLDIDISHLAKGLYFINIKEIYQKPIRIVKQ